MASISISTAYPVLWSVLPTDEQGNEVSHLFRFADLAFQFFVTQEGNSPQLELLRMNGEGVDHLRAALRAGTSIEDLPSWLAAQATETDLDFQMELLPWSVGGSPRTRNGSIARIPASAFYQTEGMGVFTEANALNTLEKSLNLRYANTDNSAYYALLATDNQGKKQWLKLHPDSNLPFLAGGLVFTDGKLNPTAIAGHTHLTFPGIRTGYHQAIQIRLSRLGARTSLYGLFPVLSAQGEIYDPESQQTLLPSDPRYRAVAFQLAYNQGNNATLWSSPDYAQTTTFTTAMNWSSGFSSPGQSLAERLVPHQLYQQFILSDYTAIPALLTQGQTGSNVFTGLAVANADQLPHALVLANNGNSSTYGFEDLEGGGDQDFNDVLVNWSVETSSAQSTSTPSSPSSSAVQPDFAIGSLALGDLNSERIPDLVVGSAPGQVATVNIFQTNTGTLLQSWQPFGSNTFGVRVACGDVNGDGFEDVVAVEGKGGSNQVMILLGSAAYSPSRYDSQNNTNTYTPPTVQTLSFNAFQSGYNGGMYVAVRDLDYDGYAEIVLTQAAITPNSSEKPAQLWSYQNGAFQQETLNLDIGALNASNGLVVALGDLNGDGNSEMSLGELSGGKLFSYTYDSSTQSFSSPSTYSPYGTSYTGGVIPTLISAQQTITQLPTGVNISDLPNWTLPTFGPSQALVNGLGVPGTLIVQKINTQNPSPSQYDLSTNTLSSLDWPSGSGSPVFASGGISYSQPSSTNSTSSGGFTQIAPPPHQVLIAATLQDSNVSLLNSAINSSQWSKVANSTNTVNLDSDAQSQWSNDWGANNNTFTDLDPSFFNSGDREVYGLATVDQVVYNSPYTVNLNPLNLSNPQDLLADFSTHFTQAQSGVNNWNSQNSGSSNSSPWGPHAPSDPSVTTNVYPAQTFQPDFALPAEPNQLLNFFQQRLISAAAMNLGINYQHHHNPLWYSPQTWTSSTDSTPQELYLATPEGRQTQGLDCTNFTSWAYNYAFGFWLNSDTSDQATLTNVTVDWLTGQSNTLTAYTVATGADIYNANNPLEYLQQNLLPGDILYLGNYKNNPNPDSATHGIIWLNNNQVVSSDNPEPLVFATGNSSDNSSFIMDSTGSESANTLDQFYPNGVQVREFNDQTWYYNNILTVTRWLTPDNVSLLANSIALS